MCTYNALYHGPSRLPTLTQYSTHRILAQSVPSICSGKHAVIDTSKPFVYFTNEKNEAAMKSLSKLYTLNQRCSLSIASVHLTPQWRHPTERLLVQRVRPVGLSVEPLIPGNFTGNRVRGERVYRLPVCFLQLVICVVEAHKLSPTYISISDHSG